ncbi:MAG: c-type cytochrome [Gammaproteobacteria bacterium]
MGRSKPLQYTIPATLCLAALLAACSPGKPPATEPAPPAQTSSSDIGGDLFEKQCGACHGVNGRGPSLATLRALSSEDLRAGIRNHPTAGTIPQRLPAAELSDLIEYLEQ